jgi:proline iminopeptidase
MFRALFFACISLILIVCVPWAITNIRQAPDLPSNHHALSLDFLSYQRISHYQHVQEKTLLVRDKTPLFYRFIQGHHRDALVVLLHGSSYHGAYLAPLGIKLHEFADICIPDIRGHGKSGKLGTCSYIGQLEDDLSDLISYLKKHHSYKKVILVGHSSGGGLAIRFGAGKYSAMADSLILLTPAIITAPTMRTPGARTWAKVDRIKIMELVALNAIGISRFNTAQVVKFNKPADQCDGSEILSYDYNLAVSLHPRIPFQKDIATTVQKTTLFVGDSDEINNPHAFQDIFPKQIIHHLEGTGHLDIIRNQTVFEEIKHQAQHISPSFTEQFVTLKNGYKLWTKTSTTGTIPVLLVHGGPGGTSRMLKPIETQLIEHGYKVITYHQLDSQKSDCPDNSELWTIVEFTNHLEEVCETLKLENFYLFGYSWGVVLAIEYALKNPTKLRGLILSNFPASSKSFETYLQKLRTNLSDESRKILDDAEKNNSVGDEKWQQVMTQEFMKKHFCIMPKQPVELSEFMSELNWKLCLHFFGQNDFRITGALADWDRWNDLKKITVPALVLGGQYDQTDPQDLKKMSKLLPHGSCHISRNASHIPFYENPSKYFKHLLHFLKKH